MKTAMPAPTSKKQNAGPDHRHLQQRQMHRRRAQILGTPGQLVMLRADAIHDHLDCRIEQFGDQHGEQTHQHDRASDTARAKPQCGRSEEHTSELQSLMRISYAVFCLKKKKTKKTTTLSK